MAKAKVKFITNKKDLKVGTLAMMSMTINFKIEDSHIDKNELVEIIELNPDYYKSQEACIVRSLKTNNTSLVFLQLGNHLEIRSHLIKLPKKFNKKNLELIYGQV